MDGRVVAWRDGEMGEWRRELLSGLVDVVFNHSLLSGIISNNLLWKIM